jgi:Fe-S oxidoreductase
MNIKWLLQATSSSDLKTKLSLLREAIPKIGRSDDIVKCMLCPNMCLHVCPVFDAERRLTVSPSTKSRLAFFSKEGENVGDAIWRCVPCDACKEVCPMDISVNESLKSVREDVCAADDEPEHVKFTFVSFESRMKRDVKLIPERTGRILYFPGCRTFDTPEVIRSTYRLFDYLNIDFSFKNEILCCGAYLSELGYKSQFEEHTLRIASYLKKFDGVVSNCPHCVLTFRNHYGVEAMHTVELIYTFVDRFEHLSNSHPDRYVYHDPCILARKLGVVEEPRKILQKAGVQLGEPIYSGKDTYCCGFGGIYPYIDATMATKIASEREKHLKEVSDRLLTSCSVCKRALNALDITELLARLVEELNQPEKK